jgi:hypothetical protein
MIPALRPLARAALRLGNHLSSMRAPTRAEMANIRRVMGEQVLDCELSAARRVRAHLRSADTIVQLWLLRAEIYQAVANEFGQPEAMRRVEHLAPLFDGLLPARLRTA